MSAMSEKMEQEKTTEGEARCWLKKHLTYKNGEKMYRVIREGKNGKPELVEVVRMGIPEVWRFVMSKDGDSLFERES